MLSEFQFIDKLRLKYSLAKIGDDCAVLPKDANTDLLLTADMLIEDIDFRLKWTTPEFLGHKALAVSLSDIAAMGGKATWAMSSIGIPEELWKTGFLDRFYAGWCELATKYSVELIGGDVSRSPDKFVVDCIVAGEVAKGKAILRSGAKVGDAIFVTGTLGAAAGGLALLEKGFEIDTDRRGPATNLVLRQLKPIPQLEAANSLQQHGIVTSMLDLSDGLSSDLAHICNASGVGAMIYADHLPVNDDLRAYFDPAGCLEMALNGGEDLELLFTASQAPTQIHATCIGNITAKKGNIELVRNGNTEPLAPRGYRHF